MTDGFRGRLAAAQARIQHGNDERTAGADDKARVIAAEVARRGESGIEEVATELGVTPKTVRLAVARARQAPAPGRTLPANALERILETELATVTPLTSTQWRYLAFLVRGTVIDAVWAEQPGQLLAYEVKDAGLGPDADPEALAAACRGWSTAQALAVIDACQRTDLTALPATGPGSTEEAPA